MSQNVRIFCGVNSKGSNIMHLSSAFPWVDHRDTPRKLPGKRNCYFSFGNDFAGPREHTHAIGSIGWSSGQRYIALDQRLFAPFCFISMPNFDIMSWVFIDNSIRGKDICHKLYAL